MGNTYTCIWVTKYHEPPSRVWGVGVGDEELGQGRAGGRWTITRGFGFRFGVWGLGFRTWGLGFRVWGLGFGV